MTSTVWMHERQGEAAPTTAQLPPSRRLLCRRTDAGQELVLKLSGPEKSDYLNFVIKDDSTGRWWVCQAEASFAVQTCSASAA